MRLYLVTCSVTGRYLSLYTQYGAGDNPFCSLCVTVIELYKYRGFEYRYIDSLTDKLNKGTLSFNGQPY